MKLLAIIFGIFGLMFILMGFYIEPTVPSVLMGILFFAIGIIFWKNSKEDPLYIGDKESPSETFRKNKERLEEIKRLRKEREL